MALCCVAGRTGRAQFSPGALSKAHRSLAGPTRCISCHTITGTVRFRCLQCHTEIQQRLNAKRGLHPGLVNANGEKKECKTCHAEHQGEDFVPIRWEMDLSEFDHSRTGYTLEGAHRKQECRKCHSVNHIAETERRKLKHTNFARTYLGLSRDCASCHEEPHHGQFSADCLQCHSYSRWKPAEKFDHGLARFQLRGLHEKVACEKCHKRTEGPAPYTKFKGLEFTGCDSCHKDPHRGAFRGPCQSCHSEAGWKSTRVTTQFDHSRAPFPLAGKHAGLACGKCHRSADFKAPVAHARCLDCHADKHNGQFASRADGGDCKACHVTDGFKPTTFTSASHSATRYPLAGRHSNLPCAKCHTPAGQATVYRVRFGQCNDCHADKHNGQFAGKEHGNRCGDCHTVEGFQEVLFTQAQHDKTRFPLPGAHAAVPCGECHNDAHSSHAQPGKFRFGDLTCAGCHDDPHKGQFRTRMAALREDGRAAGCEACHQPSKWRALAGFDHAATAFPLLGTHRAVGCDKCHKEGQPGGGVASVVFASAQKRCAGCHEDPHAGQFAQAGGQADCSHCHAPLQWKPSIFTHPPSFVLSGAHRNTQCRGCHKQERLVAGKRVVLYRTAPKDCAGCHGPEVVGN